MQVLQFLQKRAKILLLLWAASFLASVLLHIRNLRNATQIAAFHYRQVEIRIIEACKKLLEQPTIHCPPPLSSVTFAGGGFRTMSYAGQLLFLVQHHMINDATTFYGSSLGALYATAACLLYDDQDAMTRLVAAAGKYCVDVHVSWGYTWGTCESRLRTVMEECLPEDVSAAQGRLHICITQIYPLPEAGKRIVSHYDSKEDLIAAVLASMFIPGWTRGFLAPWALFRGNLALDGGFFDNAPKPEASCRTRENHWTIVDREAPLWQVFSPPRGWHKCEDEEEEQEGLRRPKAWASGVAMFLHEVAVGFEQARCRAGQRL